MAFPKIFVGGLARKTTADDLRRYFQQIGEVFDAYIITDSSRGESRGYGFVRFKDEESATKALKNPNPIINGKMANCALEKNNQPKQNVSMAFAKIFVGSLSLETTSDDLRRYFQQFGEVVEANVVSESYPTGRSYGFVTFRDAESSARALEIPDHFINEKMTYCRPTRDDQSKQKGSSNQAGSLQQYQPTPQYYYPPFLWDPTSGVYYHIYNPTSMSYYQNMMQQFDQGNTVVDSDNEEDSKMQIQRKELNEEVVEEKRTNPKEFRKP